MENTGIIYCYKNKVDGKCYIGQTGDEKKRKRDHKSAAIRNAPGCSYFHKAIRKYGMDGFEYTVLHSGKTREELNELERIEIENRNTMAPFGYNLKTGGVERVTLSDASREKMRASMKKNFSDPEYRRIHIEKMNTPEVKARVSESLKKSEKFQKANREARERRKIKYAPISARKKRVKEILKYIAQKERARFHKTEEYKKIVKSQRMLCPPKVHVYSCVPIFCITNKTFYLSATMAAKSLCLDQGCISKIIRGDGRSTGGYYFRKATDAEALEIKEQYSK